MFNAILVILLLLVLAGALPAWPQSKRWTYFPSGALILLVFVMLLILVTGQA